MCQPSRCSPKGIDTRWCASKDADPKGGGFGGSQPSRCSPKRIDTRWCASKDADPKGGGFGGSPASIGGRNECEQGRWPREEMDCDVPH